MGDHLPPWLRERLHRHLPPGSLRHRLARGVFWSSAGAAASQVVTLVAAIGTANVLGRPALGQLGVITSTLGILGVVAGLGLGATATRYVAAFRERDKARTGRILGMTAFVALFAAILLGALLAVCAEPLATEVLNAPDLVFEIRLASIGLVFATLSATQSAALAGFEAFGTLAATMSFQSLAAALLTLAGAWAGGVAGAVCGQALAGAATCAVQRVVLRRLATAQGISTTLDGWRQELPVLWQFGVPAMLAGVLGPPVAWVANAMLVNQPDGYAAMGLFVAASQWRVAVEFLPGLISRVTLPILSERYGGHDDGSSRRILGASVLIVFAATLPFVVVLGLLSPSILSLYGEGFAAGWPVMVVMLVVAMLNSLATPVGNVIIASGRMWAGLVLNGAWAVVLVGTMVFTCRLGALGLAIAWLVAYVSHLAWTAAFAWVLMRRMRR